LPSPFDKALVVFQALFLALGALLIGLMGATYVSLVGGILTAFWRASMAPFTLTFALMYGLLVDGLIPAFKAKSSKGDVRSSRIVAAVTVSTGIVGLASYYVSVFVAKIIPRIPTVVYIAGFAINVVEVAIIIAGLVNGLIAGYVASYIWKRNLRQLTAL
jgi:LytS/YehU family sensor histidine kinase